LTVLGAVWLLGERPGLRTAVSAPVILVGLAIATVRRPVTT
jgi:drug/metabolite transporter (DMT)-like permease